jgi:hypothetical protein
VPILYSSCEEMINDRGSDDAMRIGREYIPPYFHVKLFLFGPKPQHYYFLPSFRHFLLILASYVSASKILMSCSASSLFIRSFFLLCFLFYHIISTSSLPEFFPNSLSDLLFWPAFLLLEKKIGLWGHRAVCASDNFSIPDTILMKFVIYFFIIISCKFTIYSTNWAISKYVIRKHLCGAIIKWWFSYVYCTLLFFLSLAL